jgi:hypothetical protein
MSGPSNIKHLVLDFLRDIVLLIVAVLAIKFALGLIGVSVSLFSCYLIALGGFMLFWIQRRIAEFWDRRSKKP